MIIALSVICGVLGFVLLLIMFMLIKMHTNKTIIEKKGVRYTASDATKDEDGKAIATFVEGDLILEADKIYKVNRKGPIKPGRYNVLSTQENFPNVNLKINGINRTQAHDSGVVFAEGDIVVAPNVSVVLR